VHLVVNGVQRCHFEEPAAYAGLVGRHHDVITGLGELRNGLEAAGYRLPLVRVLDVGVAVDVDDAVAIQDDQLHRGSFLVTRCSSIRCPLPRCSLCNRDTSDE
jgi:hypothetical protein